MTHLAGRVDGRGRAHVCADGNLVQLPACRKGRDHRLEAGGVRRRRCELERHREVLERGDLVDQGLPASSRLRRGNGGDLGQDADRVAEALLARHRVERGWGSVGALPFERDRLPRRRVRDEGRRRGVRGPGRSVEGHLRGRQNGVDHAVELYLVATDPGLEVANLHVGNGAGKTLVWLWCREQSRVNVNEGIASQAPQSIKCEGRFDWRRRTIVPPTGGNGSLKL